MRFVPLEIIPTCTGNTQSGRLTSKFKWDHPRTCGEHSTITISPLLSVGSSPHVRGTQHHYHIAVVIRGIIPACAGSTVLVFWCLSRFWDHPRMCGEHRRPLCRWSGTRGSSPHVRGALAAYLHSAVAPGIIPACAGSTDGNVGPATVRRDHPRMCGEHQTGCAQSIHSSGSSPHVRGALARLPAWRACHGIIPACAGSTCEIVDRRDGRRDHPRMCGEHFFTTFRLETSSGSSPHVRGARAE